MSLSDHLRYLRALKGGPTLDAISEAIGLERQIKLREAEQRYRPVPDEDDLVQKLADYYERPVEEFRWHNERSRRHLTFYVAKAMREETAVSLTLRGGERLNGRAEWWDLGSIGLRGEDGRVVVVQRHAVVDWLDAGSGVIGDW